LVTQHDHAQDGAHAGHHHGAAMQAKPCRGGNHGASDQAALATDPVCGMGVDPAAAKHRFAYQGQDYFFCGARCRGRFGLEPEKFLQASEPAPPAPAGAI
jgi:Cu+-exporting ATPase